MERKVNPLGSAERNQAKSWYLDFCKSTNFGYQKRELLSEKIYLYYLKIPWETLLQEQNVYVTELENLIKDPKDPRLVGTPDQKQNTKETLVYWYKMHLLMRNHIICVRNREGRV